MDIFETFAQWIVFDLLNLIQGDQFADSLIFFIADVIKIFLLLGVMIFLVSILRTFITQKRIRKTLGGKKEGLGNILAALLGIPTPFCSCSAVPLFIGFVESGVPLGITFSFLISAPMVNEIAVVLLLSLVGWKITLLYIALGLTVAIIGGILIGRMNLEKEVAPFVYNSKSKIIKETKKTWNQRIEFAKFEVIRIIQKVGVYIIFGVGIGAFIHGYVPTDFLVNLAGNDNLFAVPIAVLIGIPLYSNAAGTIPIVEALMSKGMATGTALAFMMSVTALSLPEMIILKKVLKRKLILIFAGILAFSFILIGLFFNFILN